MFGIRGSEFGVAANVEPGTPNAELRTGHRRRTEHHEPRSVNE
jgi:hypothetical protein